MLAVSKPQFVNGTFNLSFVKQTQLRQFAKTFKPSEVLNHNPDKPFSQVFEDLYSLREEGAEIEELESKFVRFSEIMIEKQPKDMSDALLGITEFVQSSGKQQRQLINATLLLMSDIYDHGLLEQDGNLRIQFKETLDHLEKQIKINMH
jgi:hypothetical protein